MRIVKGCFLVCAVVFASGCGTMFSGTSEEVTITSNPSGANVHIDGRKRGETPVNTELSSTDNHTIEVRKQGYREEVATVTPDVNGGYVALDFFFTGLLGILVDASTEGWKTISPNQIGVTLERKSSATDETDDTGEASDSTGPVSLLGPSGRR